MLLPSEKSLDQFLSTNIAGALCSPSGLVTIRIADRAVRIKALGLLRRTGGYTRYPQDTFGVSRAQFSLLSEHGISMDVVRRPEVRQAA